ncbi:MAG: type VII toxin-antitoxin system MntA family adenylyltransferase antitoxin [Bacillota bacterium]
MDKELLKEKIIKVLSGTSQVCFAYLFGSQARGTAGALSDIDIAVFFDEPAFDQDRIYGPEFELLPLLEKNLDHRPVDLAVLNNAPVFLRYQVLKTGEILFCRSEESRIRFHEETIRLYLDFLPFRKVQNLYLKKRLTNGTFGR